MSGEIKVKLAGAVLLSVFVAGGSDALNRGETSIIAGSGQPAGDTGASYDAFTGLPVLNSAGEAAFTTILDGSGPAALMRATDQRADVIVRNDRVMNGLSEAIGFDTEPAINNRGQVAFRGYLDSDFGTKGVYLGDASGVNEIARTGGSPAFYVGDTYADSFSPPLLNDAGDVAFRAKLEGGEDDAGIYRWDGTETRRVARGGLASLETVGVPTGMNDSGSVIFNAKEPNPIAQSIFIGTGRNIDLGDPLVRSGTTVSTPGAQVGEILPNELSQPQIRDNSEVVFNADVRFQVDGVSSFAHGIIELPRDSPLLTRVISGGVDGQDSPFGGRWATADVVALNNDGQLLLDASTDTGLHAGYLVYDSAYPRGRFVFNRAALLDSDIDVYTEVEAGAFSEGGHLAISTQGGPGDSERAIYMIDTQSGFVDLPEGPVPRDERYTVAETGNMLMGSEIVDLEFVADQFEQKGLTPDPEAAATERAGVNERGQVAYWYELADGRTGIALWSPPRLQQVVDGSFDEGLFRWDIEGAGQALAVERAFADRAAELTPGSPVTLSQAVDTPDKAYDVSFDFRFIEDDGTLVVTLDGETIAELDGATLGAMDGFDTESVRLETLQNMEDTPLAFTFDGPADAAVRLDNISLRAVPEPSSLALLMIGAAGWLSRRGPRERRRTGDA